MIPEILTDRLRSLKENHAQRAFSLLPSMKLLGLAKPSSQSLLLNSTFQGDEQSRALLRDAWRLSCPEKLPNIHETMKVPLILTAPFLFQARMLPERPIVSGVLLFVRRYYPSEFRSCYLFKAQRRFGYFLVINRTTPARPRSCPPLVKVADLLPRPAMKRVVAPINALSRRFLLHEIDE